jgi:NADP-dependent 3-hydroxy acid dehydrogenase YdfG
VSTLTQGVPGNGISGKVVAVTGATSGIGEATARLLAERGAAVVLGARRTDRLDEIVRQISAAGGRAVSCVTDVTRSEVPPAAGRRGGDRLRAA